MFLYSCILHSVQCVLPGRMPVCHLAKFCVWIEVTFATPIKTYTTSVLKNLKTIQGYISLWKATTTTSSDHVIRKNNGDIST